MSIAMWQPFSSRSICLHAASGALSRAALASDARSFACPAVSLSLSLSLSLIISISSSRCGGRHDIWPENASCAARFRAFCVFRRRTGAPEGKAKFFSRAWGAENLRAIPVIVTERKAEDEKGSDIAVDSGHAAGRGYGRVGHRLQGQGAVADGLRRGRQQPHQPYAEFGWKNESQQQ